jgi:hypothetical protein
MAVIQEEWCTMQIPDEARRLAKAKDISRALRVLRKANAELSITEALYVAGRLAAGKEPSDKTPAPASRNEETK